jgi:hypothetical protein
MNELLHITYANRDNYHLHRLQTSAAYWNIPLQVLGQGEKWRCLLQKIQALHECLKDLPEGHIILFVDAYDAVYLQSDDVIKEKFLLFGRPVVFSAEMCFAAPGNESIAASYPQSPTIYRYLNSGMFIGYAAALVKIIDRILGHPATDNDQSLFSRYFVEHPDEITLDYRSELFINTSNRQYDDDLDVREGRLYNRQTGTWPCILHTPGKYYGVLEYYSRRLPFYRNVKRSRMGPRHFGQIAAGYAHIRTYRLLKRLGWVRDENAYSNFLSRLGRWV